MAIARVKGPGHPDRVCDLVAASVAEEYLRRDPETRANIRVCGGRGVLFVAGDVRSAADFDVSAVVGRTLGACGVAQAMEPFIAIEPMKPSWAGEMGREPVSVAGYATAETPDGFPPVVSLAREAARELERRRTNDADWYWLGSDYDVVAAEERGKPSLALRLEHVDAEPLEKVRRAVQDVFVGRFAGVEVRVNPLGEEREAGFAYRMGSSGLASSADLYGTALSGHGSGAGREPRHPLNAGAWIARATARKLVAEGKGKAVLIETTWLPTQSKPAHLRARNERGQDLTPHLDPSRFDLSHSPAEFLKPELTTAFIRSAYDGLAELPWEQ